MVWLSPQPGCQIRLEAFGPEIVCFVNALGGARRTVDVENKAPGKEGIDEDDDDNGYCDRRVEAVVVGGVGDFRDDCCGGRGRDFIDRIV